MKLAFNITMCVICGALFAWKLLHHLVAERPDTTSGNAGNYASSVMLFLFGGLTLVYLYRSIKTGVELANPKAVERIPDQSIEPDA